MSVYFDNSLSANADYHIFFFEFSICVQQAGRIIDDSLMNDPVPVAIQNIEPIEFRPQNNISNARSIGLFYNSDSTDSIFLIDAFRKNFINYLLLNNELLLSFDHCQRLPKNI